MILKRIGPLSSAKLGGAIYGTLGLIAGALIALASLLGGNQVLGPQMASQVGPMAPFMVGASAIIIAPLLYGALGFFGGALWAFLYNAFSQLVGGLDLDLAPSHGQERTYSRTTRESFDPRDTSMA